MIWIKAKWLEWRCRRDFKRLTPAWRKFLEDVELDPDSLRRDGTFHRIARGE